VAKQLVQFAKPPKDRSKWHPKYRKSVDPGAVDIPTRVAA
jgi:hypothetical protein